MDKGFYSQHNFFIRCHNGFYMLLFIIIMHFECKENIRNDPVEGITQVLLRSVASSGLLLPSSEGRVLGVSGGMKGFLSSCKQLLSVPSLRISVSESAL